MRLVKVTKNRTLMRNPYMQIARKIISTHEERLEDIEALRKDAELLREGKNPIRTRYAMSEIIPYGITEATLCPELDEVTAKALDNHAQRLEQIATITDQAFLQSVDDVEDESEKQKIIDCMKRYICNYREKQEEFNYLAYPRSRQDFDIRRRFVLKYVIRCMGFMPYIRQPKSLGKVRK